MRQGLAHSLIAERREFDDQLLLAGLVVTRYLANPARRALSRDAGVVTVQVGQKPVVQIPASDVDPHSSLSGASSRLRTSRRPSIERRSPR